MLGGIQWVGRPKAASEGVEEVAPLAWGATSGLDGSGSGGGGASPNSPAGSGGNGTVLIRYILQ